MSRHTSGNAALLPMRTAVGDGGAKSTVGSAENSDALVKSCRRIFRAGVIGVIGRWDCVLQVHTLYVQVSSSSLVECLCIQAGK